MGTNVRCRHMRLTITEYGGWITEHSREDDEWFHNNAPGCYNNRLDVECHDCGLRRRYWRRSKTLPRWLRVALDELGI